MINDNIRLTQTTEVLWATIDPHKRRVYIGDAFSPLTFEQVDKLYYTIHAYDPESVNRETE